MVPTQEEIRDQLERILLSQEFHASERLSDFLRFVVDETLAGRADSISQRTVAVNGLGYPANFNPQTNPAVRIQARRLRRALDQYYFTQGANDPVRIGMPKGRYVPAFSPNAAGAQVSAKPTERAPIAPAAEGSLASLPGGPSIAVMSFAFLGNDQDDNYLASGLTEETIIALTRFSDFLVIGPLSRSAIPEPGERVRRIGREYGVRFVLDGTVRKHDQALRLTSKLIDATSGEHLWAQAHDYDLGETSVQEIEGELAGRVASTVADAYGVIPRALAKESFAEQADSLSDYEPVLRFYHNIRVLTEQSHVDALAALEKTLERDPNHALAAAMLGDLTAATYQFGYEDSTDGLERAEKLGRRAVALDPNLQAARFTLALVHFLRFHRELFLQEMEHGLRLKPNHALYVSAFALHVGMIGEWERAVILMNKAMRLNPHHPGWYHLIPFMNHYRLGEYELALIEANRFNIPDFHWDPLIRAAALGQLGRQTEASKAVDELLNLVPDYKTRGRSLIRRYAYLDEHVDILAEGLRKAGFELEPREAES